MWIQVCNSIPMEVRKQFAGDGSVPSPCEYQVQNQGPQRPLTSEPSCWPRSSFSMRYI